MQVINLTDTVLKYYTQGLKIELEPHVATPVPENVVSAKKLKDCYGYRIDIIDEDNLQTRYENYAGEVEVAEPTEEQKQLIMMALGENEPEEDTNSEGENNNPEEGNNDDDTLTGTLKEFFEELGEPEGNKEVNGTKKKSTKRNSKKK